MHLNNYLVVKNRWLKIVSVTTAKHKLVIPREG